MALFGCVGFGWWVGPKDSAWVPGADRDGRRIERVVSRGCPLVLGCGGVRTSGSCRNLVSRNTNILAHRSAPRRQTPPLVWKLLLSGSVPRMNEVPGCRRLPYMTRAKCRTKLSASDRSHPCATVGRRSRLSAIMSPSSQTKRSGRRLECRDASACFICLPTSRLAENPAGTRAFQSSLRASSGNTTRSHTAETLPSNA